MLVLAFNYLICLGFLVQIKKKNVFIFPLTLFLSPFVLSVCLSVVYLSRFHFRSSFLCLYCLSRSMFAHVFLVLQSSLLNYYFSFSSFLSSVHFLFRFCCLIISLNSWNVLLQLSSWWPYFEFFYAEK